MFSRRSRKFNRGNEPSLGPFNFRLYQLGKKPVPSHTHIHVHVYFAQPGNTGLLSFVPQVSSRVSRSVSSVAMCCLPLGSFVAYMYTHGLRSVHTYKAGAPANWFWRRRGLYIKQVGGGEELDGHGAGTARLIGLTAAAAGGLSLIGLSKRSYQKTIRHRPSRALLLRASFCYSVIKAIVSGREKVHAW